MLSFPEKRWKKQEVLLPVLSQKTLRQELKSKRRDIKELLSLKYLPVECRQ